MMVRKVGRLFRDAQQVKALRRELRITLLQQQRVGRELNQEVRIHGIGCLVINEHYAAPNVPPDRIDCAAELITLADVGALGSNNLNAAQLLPFLELSERVFGLGE